ncbi:MAG: pyridoxal phosphate-dependent aminotransferase [Candidatus Marinimicrobia bacterium]|nr:pyridoxal phosphate-dependent aminotransferase [Candidatus Neomarinimicrobiota bacterium]
MMNKRIYLSPPFMGDNEKKYLNNAFDSNWIAPLGPHVDAFEEEISRYLDIAYGSALSSGTAALHLALKLLGIKEGDAVLCPSLTFAASSNVILYEKAIPVFLDVDINTWTIDLEVLELAIKKYRPKALIAVDLYGQSCQYVDIIDICNRNNVFLIEDAAEALGSEYNNRKCGTFGSLGILSFNGNKIITTSGGGMLISDNEDFINKAKFLSTQAREPVLHYEHNELGYNYRMSNLLAAIGRGQLEVLDERVKQKRNIFNHYRNQLSHIAGIDFMEEAKNVKSNRWLTTLIINDDILNTNCMKIINELDKHNIESRPVWKPMHLQKIYKDCEYVSINSDVSKKLFKKGLCLPSGGCLSIEEQDKIIEIILSTIK